MILLTGATGNLGAELAEMLSRQGHSVRILTLPNDSKAKLLADRGFEIVTGDITNPQSLKGICQNVESVVHMAGVILTNDLNLHNTINHLGTQNVLTESHESGVKHFVYISSASVVYPLSTRYSRSKIAAEACVRKSEVPWTIVRPTLLYNESGGEEFAKFVKYVLNTPVVALPADGDAKKRPIHTDDALRVLVKIVNNADSFISKTINLSGPEVYTLAEMAQLILQGCGKNTKIIGIPTRGIGFIFSELERIFPQFQQSWQKCAGLVQDADLPPPQYAEFGVNVRSFRSGLPESFSHFV